MFEADCRRCNRGPPGIGARIAGVAYRQALQHELNSLGLRVACEIKTNIRYKGTEIVDAFRVDMLVEELVIVELKAVEVILPVHRAQLLTYLRCCNKKLGLLLNFNETLLKRGIVRIANQL